MLRTKNISLAQHLFLAASVFYTFDSDYKILQLNWIELNWSNLFSNQKSKSLQSKYINL